MSICFARRAIRDAEDLVQSNVGRSCTSIERILTWHEVTALCKSFERVQGKPVDLFYAFRCMSMDVITCVRLYRYLHGRR